jgi:phosphatidate phosphatase APP1
MWRLRAALAVIVVGLPLLAPARISCATECIAVRVKPIRHICGVVVNLLGERLPNARVTVLNGETQLVAVQTDSDGHFSFENLKAGNYNIRVEADDYKTAWSPIILVKPAANCKRGLRVVLSIGMGCSGMGRAKL